MAKVPSFYSDTIYLRSRNDIDVGRNHIQKDKKTYYIFRNKNTLTFDHGQFISFERGKSLLLIHPASKTH